MAQVTGAARATGRWQVVARHYTCVHPAGFAPPAHLVTEIQTFDPVFVPLWLVVEYATPSGGEVLCGYHVIGRWMEEPDPTIADDPVKVARPRGFPHQGGVIYAQRTWDVPPPARSQMEKLNMPPLFRPFDGRLVRWMRKDHYQMHRSREEKYARLKKAEVLAGLAAEKREMARIQDEARQQILEDSRLSEKALRIPVRASRPHFQIVHSEVMTRKGLSLAKTGAQ